VRRTVSGVHRAELENVELTPVGADTCLPEEHRPRRGGGHDQGGRSEQRSQQHEKTAADHAISRVLGVELPPSRIGLVDAQQRDAAQVLHADPGGDLLEQPRDDRDFELQGATAMHEIEKHGVRCGREGDDDVLDTVKLHHLLEVPAGAEHLERTVGRGGLTGLFVEEADRHQTQLGPLAQAPGHRAPDPPRADDERPEAPP
jgi:hypothetical protein